MENKDKLLSILNDSLKIEYSMIIYYPLINMSIQDPEIKKMVNTLGIVSIKHADTVADAITSLGGTPQWDFEPVPQEMDLKKIFLEQLDKEKKALKLHTDSAHLVTEATLRAKFEAIAGQEEEHIGLVNSILDLLDRGKR